MRNLRLALLAKDHTPFPPMRQVWLAARIGAGDTNYDYPMSSQSTLDKAMRDAREGRLSAALASVRLLVRTQPKDWNAAQVLGFLLLQSGALAQALHQLERAVTANPNSPAFRNNFANALLNAQRPHEAVAQWKKALETDPTYSKAFLGLTLAFAELGDSTSAIEAGRRGMAMRPDWPELAMNLASKLKDTGRVEEAIALLRPATIAHPKNAGLRSNFLLALNYLDESVESVARAHREYAQCSLALSASAVTPPRIDPSAERPLRLGILSGDLRTHSVAYFARPIIHKVPAGCALTLFSSGRAIAGDPMPKDLSTGAEEWVDVVAMNDAAVGEAIRVRKIDVLLELGGHTSGGRLGALDHGPAPVIVTAIGYPNTTGHPNVGWRIVDSITDPLGSEPSCTERLLRIDPCFLCYSPPSDAPAPSMPPPEAPITFGSFNLAAKISARTIELWARVLAAVDHSRLLIKSKAVADEGTREHLLSRLADGGLPRNRVDVLSHTTTLHDHFASYGRVHVALDTMPYNGTTTTCEAMWMGVPTVTMLGDRHCARVGASLLSAAGRSEWVAKTMDEFVSIAVALASDRHLLAALRIELRQAIAHSPLCDEVSYGTRFHDALRGAWRGWCDAHRT